MIFDGSEVFHLGLSAALAIEHAVEEAIEAGRKVDVVGAQGTTLDQALIHAVNAFG